MKTSVPVFPGLVPYFNTDGVRSRRFIAFLIDGVIVMFLAWLFAALIVSLTLLSAGVLSPLMALTPLVAILYGALTISSSRQSTWGMRMMGLKVVDKTGHRLDFILALGLCLLYWLFFTLLTPLIAIVCLFTKHKQMLHDLVIGAIVVRNEHA